MQLDKATLSLIKKVMPLFGLSFDKLPNVEILCQDKEAEGLIIDGKFMSFAALEKELAEIAA